MKRRNTKGSHRATTHSPNLAIADRTTVAPKSEDGIDVTAVVIVCCGFLIVIIAALLVVAILYAQHVQHRKKMEALEKLEEEERKENEERQKRREAKKRRRRKRKLEKQKREEEKQANDEMQRSVIEYYKNQSQMLPVKATQYDDGPKKAGPLDEEDGDEVLERISEMNKALDKMVNKSGDDVPRQQKSSNE